MKRFLLLILIAVAVAAAGHLVSYELATREAKACLDHTDGGMAWLRREYHLSDAQFAKVARMHDAYRPTCEAMCRRIAVSYEKVHGLMTSGTAVTPETEAALGEWAALQNECRMAMLRHIYAVSAEMNPEDGRRYLQMATARIASPGMEHASLLKK